MPAAMVLQFTQMVCIFNINQKLTRSDPQLLTTGSDSLNYSTYLGLIIVLVLSFTRANPSICPKHLAQLYSLFGYIA